MRVLIVTQYFWPEQFRINDLATGLAERGHVVTVLTGKPNYPDGRVFDGYSVISVSREKQCGICIYRVPLIPRGKAGSFRLVLNYLSFALSASILGPMMVRGKFDAVIVFEPSPITVGLPGRVLAGLKKAPMLLWVQDLWPDTLVAIGAIRANWILAAVRRFVRFVYNGCGRILIQSEGFRSSIEDLGVHPDRIQYFPNSAEAVYRPMDGASVAAEDRRLPSGFRVIFAGNIGASQDFPTILSAAEKLMHVKEIQWVIIGDGRFRQWVQREAAVRGLTGSFTFVDRQPVESMPRYFAVADVLLVTLRSDPVFTLTIPSKIQSYLACGRPIVGALDGEGLRIIEDSGAGFCAPAGDADALADAIQKLFEMPKEQRERMGRRGIAYYKKQFDRDLLLNKLEGWLQELTEVRECVS